MVLCRRQVSLSSYFKVWSPSTTNIKQVKNTGSSESFFSPNTMTNALQIHITTARVQMAFEVSYATRNTVMGLGLQSISSPRCLHVQFNIEDHVASRIGRQRQKSARLPYATLHTSKFEFKRDQSHVHVPVVDSQAAMSMSMSMLRYTLYFETSA